MAHPGARQGGHIDSAACFADVLTGQLVLRAAWGYLPG